MKRFLHPQNMPLFAIAGGSAGALLLIWLQTTGNAKGFVDTGHISAVLLAILVAAVVAVLFIGTRCLTEANKYSFNFPPSAAGAVLTAIAAAGYGVTAAFQLAAAADPLDTAACITGLVCVPVLLYIAHCRQKGLRPTPILHSTVCIHLMLRLLCMYRQWSADPQVLDYCFQLLAVTAAMLAVYHRATFCADCGSRRAYVFFDLCAVFFCLLALPNGVIVFYLSTAAWLAGDLCSLRPMPPASREEA